MRLAPTLFALALSTAAAAQSLDWPQCVRLARDANPELEAARQAVASARAAKRGAESGYYPSLTGTAGLNRVGLSTAPDQTVSSLGLDVEVPIFSGFSTRAQQLAARSLVAQREAELAALEVRLRASLRNAFADTLNGQAGLALDRAIAARLDQNARFIRLRYEGGVEARWASAKADADAMNARWQTERSERDLTSARRRLGQLLGRVDDTAFDAVGDLDAPPPPPSVAPWEASVPREHPDARALARSADAAFERIRGARSGYWPVLTGSAAYNRLGTNGLPDDETAWSAGGGLTWLLFSGLATVAGVDEALAVHAELVGRLRAKELELSANLTASYASYASSVGRLPSARASLAAADERLKIVGAQYAAGLKAFLDWDQAQTFLTVAQRADLDARYQALRSLGGWEQAIGKGLQEP